jgi:hypothetical protein
MKNPRHKGRDRRHGQPLPLEVATIRLAVVATVPVQHRRSRHRDEAVVGVKNAIRFRPPHTQAQQRGKSVSVVELRPGRPLGGDDDPLLILWTMLASTPTQAEDLTDDDEMRGVGYGEQRASTARDRREP